MIRLGLTGGIGSGKSTVALMLAQRGAVVIDADAISRELTAKGGRAIPQISSAFGHQVINPDGSLNREQMRALAFANDTARKRLEAIIHPLVGEETRSRAQAAAEDGVPCAVFDIPLLVESGHWRGRLDHVMVIDCSPEQQTQRVMARSKLQRQEVEKIIASQASRQRRLAAADTVIVNDRLTMDQLCHEVDQISLRFGLSSTPPAAPLISA